MSRIVLAAGGVVYSYDPAGYLVIVLIQDRYGTWTLPKGHLDPGEDDATAAQREIWEETGLHVTLEQPLTAIRYPINRRGVWRTKQVTYFLARASYSRLTPAIDEGITDVAWFRPEDAVNKLNYDQLRMVLRTALQILNPDAQR